MKQEPLRHSSGKRNRRKLLHHVKCLEDELAFIDSLIVEMVDKLRYVRGRTKRIKNRLHSEI